MSSKNLENLVKTKKLKQEPFNQNEFNGLIQSGEARLKDASLAGLSEESRFDLAYNAAHAFSLAALRWHGYRPDNCRYIVFAALPHTLEIETSTSRVLAKCHETRNLAEYERNFEVDSQLLEDLFRAVNSVREKATCLEK